MTRAFVLSGGASLGASQAGMAQLLLEEGIHPELIVGSSVGAVNGAWLAGGCSPGGLCDLWRTLRRQDLFPTRLPLGFRAFLGRSSHYVSDSGLRHLLERHVTFARLDDASIPFAVVTTEVPSGAEIVLQRGPSVDAVLASAALPAVFPPVTIDGRVLIDGGVVDNTPITTAIELGATEVWVLSTGSSCALSEPPTSAFAMHSVGLMVQRRLALEVAIRDYDVPVHLIPPPCPIDISPVDFSYSAELIDRAVAATRQWLADGQPDSMHLLAPHVHS